MLFDIGMETETERGVRMENECASQALLLRGERVESGTRSKAL